MRHFLPGLRQDAIRWLGRALAVSGLLALLALPIAAAGSGTPFTAAHAGIDQLEKALPAELRTARPATVVTAKASDETGSEPADDVSFAAPDREPGRMLPSRPARTDVARALFPRPASQAPPASI